MPEMHLRQPGFTYGACRPFTKQKEITWKLKKKTRDFRYIYQNELDEACFQHDMAYGDFKDLPRRIASDKVLRDKAFNITNNPKYDGYQRGLASMVYKLFDKKSSVMRANKFTGAYASGGAVEGAQSETLPTRDKSGIVQNQQLAEELHKTFIRKPEKQNLYSFLKTIIVLLNLRISFYLMCYWCLQ